LAKKKNPPLSLLESHEIPNPNSSKTVVFFLFFFLAWFFFYLLFFPCHLFQQESERQVTRAEGETAARRHGTLFIEASARTREGVAQAFDELVHKVYDTPSLWKKSDGAGAGTGGGSAYSRSQRQIELGPKNADGDNGYETSSGCPC
jgi:hypothetical protein